MLFDKTILQDRKIAILAADGFDESQLFSPKRALEEAGAEVVIVSLNRGEIKAWEKDHWGKSIPVDATVQECHSEEFDGLLIPGGEKTFESLHDKSVVDFVKEFVYDGKSIASICHGTKVLIDSGMAKGRMLATGLTMKNDVIKSGGKWMDSEVAAHKGIITTRCPEESQSFNRKMIEGFAIGPKRPLLH